MFFKLIRRGSSLCASYFNSCSVVVERRGRITPGGVKLLARTAEKGIVEVVSENKALRFTHGGSVKREFVRVAVEPCEKGLALVYWNGVLLGLGKLGKELIPLVDLGEFLRRGY